MFAHTIAFITSPMAIFCLSYGLSSATFTPNNSSSASAFSTMMLIDLVLVAVSSSPSVQIYIVLLCDGGGCYGFFAQILFICLFVLVFSLFCFVFLLVCFVLFCFIQVLELRVREEDGIINF